MLHTKKMAAELGVDESLVNEVLLRLAKFREGDKNVNLAKGFMG